MKTRIFENREQWLAWRKGGIGGSDVPKVLNLSRFGDRLDVYLDKTGLHEGPPINETLKVKADVAENAARERLLADKVVHKPLKPVNIEHEEETYLRCSLDGWNEDRVLFEHKLLGNDNFEEIKNYKGFGEPKPAELVSILAQISYQAMLCKPNRVILGITHYQSNEFYWTEVTKILPKPTKIKNRVKKLWNYISSSQKSPQS